MSSDLTASACAAALAGYQAPSRRRYHAVQVTKYAFGDPRTSDSSGVSNSHSTENSLVAPVPNTSTLCPPGDEHVESLLNSLMAIPPRRPAPPGPAGAQAMARKLQRGASGTGLVGNGGGSLHAHEGLLPEAVGRVAALAAPGSLEAAAAMASVGQAHELVQGGSQGPPGTTAGMASIGGIPHYRANHAAILKTAPAILTTRPPFHPASHGLSSFSGGNSPVTVAEHYRAQLGASADLPTAAAAAAAAQAGTHTTSLSGSEDEGKDEPATYVEQGRTAMKQDYLDEDATTDSEEEAQRRRARKRAASQRGRVSKAAAANERKEMCRERNRTAQRRFRERQRELIRVLQDKVDEQEALIRSLRKRLAIYEPPVE
ncbi:hypothetical protein GPECTOR_86g383 [Gonium pectorale]|uniref:BZIP domain-containing protein n=1 Tax=Gonium pectorale TaxID=33097 RepID=A0A150G2Q2_GONPE|nr:hypothetical protein GPECTOR_86g383 [Gonium pectorale]|eukprot:KXZ43590.1 hypothetical protein GPECTOR_86g383 [Gonium pectorale]